MNPILKNVKNLSSECCVTILLNTHRTVPDNQKDPIVLKNLIKQAGTRLAEECNPAKAPVFVKKLEELADSIDHRHNLESLILFVNEQVAEYTRLPIHVDERVVIDETFATRDLIRSMNEETAYYILVLSRDKARLIQAYNDRVIAENTDIFPIKNVGLQGKGGAEGSLGGRQTNLQQEFFNIVDKQVVAINKKSPAPVFIVTDEANYHQYMKIADNKDIIKGYFAGNRDHEKPHQIISAVWPMVLESRKERLQERIGELKAAQGAGKVLSDFNDIWTAVNQGRGKTLFVKQGYFQPAKINGDTLEIIESGNPEGAGIVDDIIDEIIEANMSNGGDAVFITGDELNEYQGLALVTRF